MGTTSSKYSLLLSREPSTNKSLLQKMDMSSTPTTILNSNNSVLNHPSALSNKSPNMPSTQSNKSTLPNVEKRLLQEPHTNPVLGEWNLNSNAILQIILDKNYKLRIYIRIFKESSEGELLPTKAGIVLTPPTWECFQEKIRNFQFKYKNESFIANNQLLIMTLNEDAYILQQIIPQDTLGYTLKSNVLKLYQDQVNNIIENRQQIRNCIIESKFFKQLPSIILNSKKQCFTHSSLENTKQNYLKCIVAEIRSCTENIFRCKACELSLNSFFEHSCASHLSTLKKFTMCYSKIMIHCSVNKIIENVTKLCTCHYDFLFFSQFNLEFLLCFIEDNL